MQRSPYNFGPAYVPYLGELDPAVADLINRGLTVFSAERLRSENLKRIKAGLPVLTSSQSAALAPTANISLDAQTRSLIIYGLLGLGALILFTRK